MARVSFLLPLYNGAAHLAETMQSLLDQSFDDFDILIVNDGSTDHWQEIIAGMDVRKIRIHNQENSGLVNALNAGIELLDCEFVARIDADDICAPDRLEEQLDFLNFTQAHAVSNRVVNIDEHGKTIGLRARGATLFEADNASLPAAEPYLPHSFLTIRLDVLREIGVYRHAHLAEDADLCWRLFRDYKIAVQDRVLGKYRIHSNSISSNNIKRGRVQAFYSQLAALNARRFEAAEKEVDYLPDIRGEIDRAESIDTLLQSYREALQSEEARWLEVASMAKLVDLGRWRDYRLDEQDINDAKKLQKLIEKKYPLYAGKYAHNLELCLQKRDEPPATS